MKKVLKKSYEEQMDEGYIKFNAEWIKSKRISHSEITALNVWRQRLYEEKLLGVYPDGIGYGNISQRSTGNHFFISGSKTGQKEELNASDYAEVIAYDRKENWVKCEGETIASSESMSHAVLYEHCQAINAVFHIHSLKMWKNVLWKIPTTPISAPYGSPEMAEEIIRLMEQTDVLKTKVFAMAGHREGIFSFGNTLDEAGTVLLELYQQLR